MPKERNDVRAQNKEEKDEKELRCKAEQRNFHYIADSSQFYLKTNFNLKLPQFLGESFHKKCQLTVIFEM